MSDVGARGWVVLTKDSRIRRHPLELEALLATSVAAFLLTAKGVTGLDMADILVRALPKMTTLVQTRARPLVATIARSGQIRIVHGGARRGGVRRR